jgi:hypothetical protein
VAPTAPATSPEKPFWAALAAIGSLAAALVALWSTFEGNASASRDQLRQAMQLYLTTYMQVMNRLGPDAVHHANAYQHLSQAERANIPKLLMAC